MSEDSYQPQPIAQWNPLRMLWETGQGDLFSEHLEPYSETFPTSGMTRNGALLPLPTLALATGAKGCSSLPLLPTPSVADGMGGHATRSGSRSDELLLPGVAKAAAEGKL